MGYKVLAEHGESSGGDESGDGVTVLLRVPDVKIHLVLYTISSKYCAHGCDFAVPLLPTVTSICI